METLPEYAPLENYLDRLCVWLALMPEAERDDLRVEMRQHFQALVATKIAEGADPEGAERAAFGRLGDADEVGRRLGQAWRDKADRQMRRPIPARTALLQKSVPLAVVSTGILALVMWLWFNLIISVNSWPLDLAGSAGVGIVLGLVQVVFEAQLYRLGRPMSKQGALSHADTLSRRPTLPPNASFRSKVQYHRSELSSKSLENYFQRVAENPANQYQLFPPIPLWLMLLAITILIVVAQSQDHGVSIPAKSFAELLTIFTTRGIVESIVHRRHAVA